MTPRCPNCDGAGDVDRIDGEWLGECDCNDRPSLRDVLACVRDCALPIGLFLIVAYVAMSVPA